MDNLPEFTQFVQLTQKSLINEQARLAFLEKISTILLIFHVINIKFHHTRLLIYYINEYRFSHSTHSFGTSGKQPKGHAHLVYFSTLKQFMSDCVPNILILDPEVYLDETASMIFAQGPSINYVGSVGEQITPKNNLINRTYLVKKDNKREGRGSKIPDLETKQLMDGPSSIIQIFAKLVLTAS